MKYVVKDTSQLKKYGFELVEEYYDEDDEQPITNWKYVLKNNGLETWWIEVPETDYIDGKEGIQEAWHGVYCHRASGFALEDEDWFEFFPKLVELYNDGIIKEEK